MTKEKAAKSKKEVKEEMSKEDKAPQLEQITLGSDILTVEDLKKFLGTVRDRMSDGTCAPVFALSALSHVLGLQNIYKILNEENREIARDIWLRLKQVGLHIKSPPMLFDAVNGEVSASR